MDLISKNIFSLQNERFGRLTVVPRIFMSEELAEPLTLEYNLNPDDSTLTQLASICFLPGIIDVVGLPDLHRGYGFPIGSVAAFDPFDPCSVVCPLGVGYDINCGVRGMVLDISKDKLIPILDDLLDDLSNIENTTLKLRDLNGLLDGGLQFLIDLGFIKENLDSVESRGFIPGNSRLVSQKAKGRGLNQLETLGKGNHFLEIQFVDKIYDKEKANVMGIQKEGQLVVMIHTGSRALGHIVCGEYLEKAGETVPLNSVLGQEYMFAMGSAANFAFGNRALIAEKVKQIFGKYFKGVQCQLIYDASHNIAKKEIHRIDGVEKELLVHRKGAARSFGPGQGELRGSYGVIGQPVMVGGSMGTSSYILCGTNKAMELSLGSTCHGAGRIYSRNEARIQFTHSEVAGDLLSQGIKFRCGSESGLVEEAPGAYKNIESVIDVSVGCGITERICRVKPIAVIKE
ncbi:tRNA-splicing ligase RtcB [Astathelohania contejeani]|uniref:3'-phosphate/5'-hydroxy nucleic acid ligase n=1 Tax=Astathelohania contejeani TaxID=164912 RepID=A0ABQ7I0M1_9MICR|nr:tRNA-splicing ligase RtcB [Thelohania contejeani]